MNNNRATTPGPTDLPVPGGTDLDDLIFQDESWLASDR